MDGLNLKTEQDLRIYCLTAHPDSEPEPHKARFMLAYNLEEVQNAIINKYVGRNVIIEVHGSIRVVSIVSKIMDNIADGPGGMEKAIIDGYRLAKEGGTKDGILPGNVVVEPGNVTAETPESKRNQFIMNLRLIVDKFLSEEDAATVRLILEKLDKK